MVFSIFTVLCSPHHYLIPGHFHPLRRNVYPWSSRSSLCPPPSPQWPLIYFFCIGVPVTGVYRVLVCQYFISFYAWIIFHYMDRPLLVYPVITWWTFGLLPLFWLFWIILLWTFVDSFCVDMCSLGDIPSGRITGSYDNRSAFWGAGKLFSTATAPFYILTSWVWAFQFLHILAVLVIFLLFVCLFFL